MIPAIKSIVFDRHLFRDSPHIDTLPGLVLWDLCGAIDAMLRSHGVAPIVWEVRDDGVVMNVVPFFPGDCEPEAREAISEILKFVGAGLGRGPKA